MSEFEAFKKTFETHWKKRPLQEVIFWMFWKITKLESQMKKESKSQSKVHKVMKEFKEGKLHSGSKKGPEVKSRKQAIAIAMSEAGKSKKKR